MAFERSARERSAGEWLVARNTVAREGSIHDDEAARRQGFSGGLVGGNVHVVVVTAALVERFGQAWYERGSMAFTWARPLYDGEEMRVELTEPAEGDDRVGFELVKRDGTVSCAGWASAADAVAPWERADAPAPRGRGDYDPLPERVGDAYETREVVPDTRLVAGFQGGFDDNPWYTGGSPWGRPVVPTTAQLVLNGYGMPGTPREVSSEMRTGMNASTQVLQTGPMFVGEPFTRTGVLAAKGVQGRYAFRTIEFANTSPDGRVLTRFLWTIKWATARPRAQAT